MFAGFSKWLQRKDSNPAESNFEKILREFYELLKPNLSLLETTHLQLGPGNFPDSKKLLPRTKTTSYPKVGPRCLGTCVRVKTFSVRPASAKPTYAQRTPLTHYSISNGYFGSQQLLHRTKTPVFPNASSMVSTPLIADGMYADLPALVNILYDPSHVDSIHSISANRICLVYRSVESWTLSVPM